MQGNAEVEVQNITFDSRDVQPGWLFVAVRGVLADGHQFIPKAIEKGATAIVAEEMPAEQPPNVPVVLVKNSRLSLAELANNFYDRPSEELELVGVTGTNGKTTTATLLYQLFSRMGHTSGLLSTVRVLIAGEEIATSHTTPDPLTLNRLLRQMVSHGCEYCFMEVSSHAVDQERVAGLHFLGGIFTNLTHEHLDYHESFKAYLRAKQQFFDMLPKKAFALYNSDDKNGRVMVQNTAARIKSYALKNISDYHARILESDINGMQLRMDEADLFTTLTGRFNAYNLLAVYAAACELGVDKEDVLQHLSALRHVEGRMDLVRGQGITGIVDFAHTPDALENLLQAVQEMNVDRGNIITVVGCGGNRDRAKRPQMAKISVRFSDRVILTSDNPRNEDPEAIIEEMKQGLDPQQQQKVLSIANRREAIRTACTLAQPGDLVIVAGKGHEKYQEIKGEKRPFDDKQELVENLKAMAR